MERVYTNWLRILGVLGVVWLLGGEDVRGQSGRVKLEIRVDKVIAMKDGEADVRGKNEYRYDFWINLDNATELQLEMNDVSDSDLPKSKTFSQDNTITQWVDYNAPFLLTMEAWEEDCGEDNKYNHCDDVHCKKEYTIPYTTTEPGIWHKLENSRGSTPLWCPDIHSAFVYFRWSPPKPPNPIPENTKVCKDEMATQFKAKNNLPYSKYVDEYEWEISKRALIAVDSTETQCENAHGNNNTKYYNCLYDSEPAGYEYEYEPIDYVSSDRNVLEYAMNSDSLWVSYREIYKNGTKSPWSEKILKKHQFHNQITPASIATYEYGSNTETNLICGSIVKLKALHPNGGTWENHRFYWYRKIEGVDTEPVLIRGGEQGSTSDSTLYTIPTEMEGKKTYFSVQTRYTTCKNRSDIVKTGSIFLFKPVPATFTVNARNTGRIQYRATSCVDAQDGKVIIGAKSDEFDKYFYYNVALKNTAKPNDVEPTSILSSPKMKGNESFTFPDDVVFPGESETGFTEEEWRSYTNITTGTYTVQVINGGGDKEYKLDTTFENEGYCFEEFDIIVKSEPEVVISNFSTTREISCHAGNDGEMSVEFNGGRTPYHLQLFKGTEEDFVTASESTMLEAETTIKHANSSGYTFKDLSTGHYKVRITLSDAACWKETETSVYLDQPAPLSLANNDVSRSINDESYHDAWITCPGANDAYLEVNPQGGNLAREYVATLYKDDVEQASETFIERHRFANLSPGAYHLKVEDACADNIPVFSDTFSIYEPSPLTIDSVRTNPITCHGVANGQITVSSQGGTGTRQFIIDGDTSRIQANVSQEVALTDLDSGWHTVEVVDINGCVASEPFSFHLKYPTPLNYELDSLMKPLCYGGEDGKLFIRPFGGDTITQDYTVTIRSIVSAKYPKLVERISGTYTSTMPPIEFNELPSAYYEVTVTDASTQSYICSKVVDTVFLPQPDLIVLDTVRVTLPSCAGASDGAIHVKAARGTPGTTPDYYYSINGVTYVAPNEMGIAIFTDLKAGNHTFYAIDAHHAEYLEGYDTLTIDPTLSLCVGTFNFTLEEPEFITVYPTITPVTCYGTATGSITIDSIAGGWGIYTYEWSILDPTANTPDGYRTLTPADPAHLSDVPYGNYRLIVRDTAGCASTTTMEVTQPEIPLVISAVQQYSESCAGTADGKLEIRAEGGYPPYTYQIDGGTYQISGFFDGLTAGPYMLRVRDQRGCEVQQMANLAADDIAVAVTDQLPATVGFQDGLLRLTVTGGQNKSYYLDGVLSTTGAEFSGLTAGEHTVAITYNGKCQWKRTYTIDEVAAPVPALRVTTQSLQNVRCSEASDGSVSVSITGGIAPYTLQWDDPQQQTTSKAIGLAKGPYTLTVTDAAGVVLEYPVTIDGPELFEVINTVAASPACHQGADGYAEVTIIGGTAPYTYTWNDDEQQTTARASALTAGTYIVTVTDQNGCTLTQELTVKPTPAPDDLLEPQAITLCTGQSVTVDAGLEGSTYQWTADNGFHSEVQSITINQAGRYFLQVTTPQGCTAYDTLDLVTTENLIDAEFLLPTEIAAGDTVVLTEVSWPAPEQTVWLYDENVTTHQSDGEKEYVVFPESGEYTIKLVVMVGDCTDEVEKKIIVSDRAPAVSVPNGRLGYLPKNEYLIYPNPSHGKFTLKISTAQAQRVRVSVYDPLFKYRYEQRTFADTQMLEEAIDLTHLKHGVYHLMIETNDEIKILRFVIR